MMSQLSLRIAAVAAMFLPSATAVGQDQPAGAEPRHYAIAINPAYVGYFVVTGEKKDDGAAKAAMRLCSKATGKGCELLMSGKGRHLITGYGPDGTIFLAVRQSAEEARAALDADCRKAYGGTCFVDNSFDIAVKAKLETAIEPRKFAALAYQVDAENQPMTEDDRIWFAGGQPSAQAAIDNAMTRCTAAVGAGKCRHVVTSGQTHIAFYRDAEAVSGGFQISLSSQAALGAVDRQCRAETKRCVIVALHPAAESAEREYDLRTMSGVPLD